MFALPMYAPARTRWRGSHWFLVRQLVMKDFRVRYRNMSLGALWSLLNPLIMMGVLTFVFTRIFKSSNPDFPVFVLCGIVPYNFFAIAWVTGTTSLVDSAPLVKRLPVPREVIPIAAVLSNCVHLGIQFLLLITLVVAFGHGVNRHWVYLPAIWALEIVFVTGLAFLFSGVNVLIRDTRYLVESINTVLFWLVPIFYGFEIIPQQYREIYQYNPVAAVVLALRNILLDDRPPAATTLVKLSAVSIASVFGGLIVFQRMKHRVYENA